MNHWSTELLGLPWIPAGRGKGGYDCLGLVIKIYKDQLGIEIDERKHISPEDVIEYSKEIDASVKLWNKLDRPEDYCVVAMSRSKVLHHVGIYLKADGGLVLHCHESSGVIIQTIDDLKKGGWNRIEFYGYNS